MHINASSKGDPQTAHATQNMCSFLKLHFWMSQGALWNIVFWRFKQIIKYKYMCIFKWINYKLNLTILNLCTLHWYCMEVLKLLKALRRHRWSYSPFGGFSAQWNDQKNFMASSSSVAAAEWGYSKIGLHQPLNAVGYIMYANHVSLKYPIAMHQSWKGSAAGTVREIRCAGVLMDPGPVCP